VERWKTKRKRENINKEIKRKRGKERRLTKRKREKEEDEVSQELSLPK
jgi:hypothetical protein